MESRSHLLVEAGTGVGKSFAYLVPAIRRAVEHHETVIVATNTIALQEQIVGKDVPLLEAALAVSGWEGRLKAVLVKGRGNYLSIRRLQLASDRALRLFAEDASRRSLEQVQHWAMETDDGTLSTLPVLERPGIWDRVQSDVNNCMGRKCPHHEACFYQEARRRMEGANLLICNHALFFSDLAMRAQHAGFLPTAHHVILDEAHNLEDVASEHFGRSLSEGRVMHLLGQLYHARTGKGFLSQLGQGGLEGETVERAMARVLDADDACRAYFDGLHRVSESDEVKNGRLRRAGMIENPLTDAMGRLAVLLRLMKEEVRSEEDRYELNAYAIRAAAIADDAEALVEQKDEACVYWADVSAGTRGARVTHAAAPVDVAPLLREHLFAKEFSVTLTSATLATRTVGEDESTEHGETAFAHVIRRLGAEGASTLQLGSPFEYARQVRVFVDRTMSTPGYGRPRPGQVVFEDALTDRIVEHVDATDGGAFVLFTSFRMLHDVADRIRGHLAERSMPLLVQGRDGPRSQLLDRFRSNDRSVLFGAASFWQGVDVRGDGLRNVIIARLPFEPPDRPL
ncbi:MAG: hypothetical protein KDA28_15020, partial [Phycisphaerales bacterium]|nr:hypothetical protein [Phycisphaerales bacterium]